MAALKALLILTFVSVFAISFADPDMLQDVCVADPKSGITCQTLLFLFYNYKNSLVVTTLPINFKKRKKISPTLINYAY